MPTRQRSHLNLCLARGNVKLRFYRVINNVFVFLKILLAHDQSQNNGVLRPRGFTGGTENGSEDSEESPCECHPTPTPPGLGMLKHHSLPERM